MPSCHSLILLLLYGARQACMVPPKAQRLPGSLDCTAEMFHGSGHKAAREADPRPLIVSVCQIGEGKASKILAFVPFQCCLSPASCASETKPAPLTAKRRHLWTISFFSPFDFMVFLFLFPSDDEKHGEKSTRQRVSRLRVSYDADQAMRRRSPPHQQTWGHKTRPDLPPAC